MIVAILAGYAFCYQHIELASDSCPVKLKIMPVATVVAPDEILVDITEVDHHGIGQSSGADYGTFSISTNQVNYQLKAEIGEHGLTGGHWSCMLQGDPSGYGLNNNYDMAMYDNGPVPDSTPFNVFVQVRGVDMTAVVFEDDPNEYTWDTQLTLTLSTQ